MSWMKVKKAVGRVVPAAVVEVVERLLRYIWNNRAEVWEVWDKTSGTLDHLETKHGEIVERTADLEEQISKTYDEAEQYVQDGISDAKDVWGEVKGVFK